MGLKPSKIDNVILYIIGPVIISTYYFIITANLESYDTIKYLITLNETFEGLSVSFFGTISVKMN
jgi:hypothetical protein